MTKDDVYSFCVAEKFWILGLEPLYRWRYVKKYCPDASLEAIAEGLAEWEGIYEK